MLRRGASSNWSNKQYTTIFARKNKLLVLHRYIILNSINNLLLPATLNTFWWLLNSILHRPRKTVCRILDDIQSYIFFLAFDQVWFLCLLACCFDYVHTSLEGEFWPLYRSLSLFTGHVYIFNFKQHVVQYIILQLVIHQWLYSIYVINADCFITVYLQWENRYILT